MITLVVSGRGGPMLLSLSGCLVGSGMWYRVTGIQHSRAIMLPSVVYFAEQHLGYEL